MSALEEQQHAHENQLHVRAVERRISVPSSPDPWSGEPEGVIKLLDSETKATIARLLSTTLTSAQIDAPILATACAVRARRALSRDAFLEVCDPSTWMLGFIIDNGEPGGRFACTADEASKFDLDLGIPPDEDVFVYVQGFSDDHSRAAVQTHRSGNGGVDSIAAREEQVIDVSPVGIALAIAGTAAMLIAAFLPLWDPTSANFTFIQENTLIQEGSGWFYVSFAIVAAGSLFRAHQLKKATWGPLILGAIGLAYAVYIGTDKDTLTLCPVEPSVDKGCEVASPGIGVYVAGVGALLMLVAGWQIRSSKRVQGGPGFVLRDTTAKKCPDCAESVLVDARVCKHCGYRFEPGRGRESAESVDG